MCAATAARPFPACNTQASEQVLHAASAFSTNGLSFPFTSLKQVGGALGTVMYSIIYIIALIS